MDRDQSHKTAVWSCPGPGDLLVGPLSFRDMSHAVVEPTVQCNHQAIQEHYICPIAFHYETKMMTSVPSAMRKRVRISLNEGEYSARTDHHENSWVCACMFTVFSDYVHSIFHSFIQQEYTGHLDLERPLKKWIWQTLPVTASDSNAPFAFPFSLSKGVSNGRLNLNTCKQCSSFSSPGQYEHFSTFII